MKNLLHKSRGFTLIETLMYISILVIIMLPLIYSFRAISVSYHRVKANKAVASSAITAIEKISREVHSATSIDVARSTFGTSPGVLYLNTIDENGVASTTEFYLSGQVMHLKIGGVDQGPLTLSTARVTNLVFRSIDTTQSKAIKMDMTIESGTSTAYISKKFYDTAVLRGLYQ